MVLPSNALASARLSRLKIATSCENTGKNKVLVVEDSKSIRELLCAYINNLHAIGADSAASLSDRPALYPSPDNPTAGPRPSNASASSLPDLQDSDLDE